MRSGEIEKLLVEWELARQEGRLLEAGDLCGERKELKAELDTQIEILQRTEWMLSDPAGDVGLPGPVDDLIAAPVHLHPQSSANPNQSSASVSDQRKTLELDTDEALTHPSLASATSNRNAADGEAVPGQSQQELRQQLAEAGFEVEKELGRGGFGIVYQAIDKELNRRVALKVGLHNNRRTDLQYLQEARNAALVEVDGLIPVLQVGKTADGTPFVVQKLIDGDTLATLLRSERRLTTKQTVDWLSQVCRAVAKAHAHSLVHRDLKPGNILIDANGKAWVADFGLSVTEEDLDSNEVHLRAVAGTPAYMAPEQLSEFVERLDGRCDIWAIGVMLYEMLTGKRPFRGRELRELREQILLHDPRPISQRRPELNSGWNEIFRRCCAKKAEDRYANAFELAAELEVMLKIQEASSGASGEQIQPLSEANNQLASAPTVRSSGASAFSTASQSSPVDLIDRQPSKRIAKRAYLALVFVALSMVTAAFFLLLWKPEKSMGDAEFSDRLSVDELTWLVAADGSGDFVSLSAALDAVRLRAIGLPDVELRLAPGNYFASTEIEQNLKIRGLGSRGQVVIEGRNQPAFRIAQQADLQLSNLTVRVNADPGSPTNTMEVQAGRLQLRNCVVEASGYDCVRVEPESEFIAEERTVFRVGEHPAVYAKRAERLELRECRFEFLPMTLPSNGTRVGLQVRQCGGIVADCVFSASSSDIKSRLQTVLATGIDWGDSDAKVEVRDCRFENLQIGLAGFNCGRLHVFSLSGASPFTGCKTGIDISECSGEVANCEIVGEMPYSQVGIQVSNQQRSAMLLRGVSVSNVERGLVLNQAMLDCSLLDIDGCGEAAVMALGNSELSIADSQISMIAEMGLLVEDSHTKMERVEISDCRVAGIVVDGSKDALQLEDCRLDRNRVGILMTSGSALLENSEIAEADTGLLVSRKHLLQHQVTGDAPLRIDVNGGAIHGKVRAVQFLSPGAIRLHDCQLHDRDGGKLSSGGDFEAYQDGEWYEVKIDSID